MKTNIIIFVFFFCVFNAFSNYQGSFTYSVNDFTVTQSNNYHILSLNDCGYVQTPGSPMLPLMSYTYIIPFGKKVSNVIVTNIEEALYAGTYSIYPAQTGFYDAEFTGPDATIYNTNSFYPASAIQYGKSGNLNGAKLSSITICPVKYNPITGVVKIITKIDFTLVYSDDLITNYVKPGFTNQQSYNSLINQVGSLVQNKTDVSSLINIPIPTSTAKNLPSSLLSGNINANVDFVIITNDALKSGFQPIIEWKLKNGITAAIVTTEWIYQNYTGCDQPEQIRMFIKDICQNWNTQYVLLGGGKDIIPLRYVWINAGPDNTPYGQFTVTDLYYSCLDGNWNADGDVTFGEARYNRIEGASPVHVGISADIDGVDVWPDIKVSRIPVNNVTELTNAYVPKYFEYVQPSQSNALNKNNVLLFSGPTAYSDTDLLWSGPYANDNLRQSFPTITPAELFYNPSSGNPPGTKPLVLDAINGNYNNTKFHIICGYGHGLEDKFQACGYSNINSSFITKSEIDGLTNTDRGQILFLNHCLTMAWDRDGIANHYITANNGGVAILGYNRLGIIFSPRDQNKPFFENIYGIDNHMGVAFNNAKVLNHSDVWNPPTTDNNARWNFFTFNMNADPNMEVWTDNPASFTSVTVTPSTINTQNVNVKITVNNVPADLTVTFTLYKNGEVFATKTIISDAPLPKTWTFSDILVKTAADGLSYTITAKNYVPYEGIIPVNFTDYSHLYVLSNAITDNNNNNTKAEAGEIVTMGITLKNVGTIAATKILTLDWEKLNPNDDVISINTETQTYTNIAANEIQLRNYIITINAASTYLTDGRNIHFYLKEGTAILTDFYLQVYKPEYTLTIKNITNSGSDDNLTTGESATMILELFNTSLADAKNVTAVLSENGTCYTTITQNTGSFGNIAYGGAAQNSNAFSFTVNSIPPGGKYFFDLVISSDYNPQCTTILVNVPSPVHPQPIECSALKFTNTGIENTYLNNDEILVYWEPVSDAIGYNIYRCNSNENGDNIGSYVKLNTSLLLNAFYKDISSILTTQSYYNYKITKINQYAIESAFSCELHAWTSMIAANWPVETGIISTSPLNVADVNNDGLAEIFAVKYPTGIAAYTPAGAKFLPVGENGFNNILDPSWVLLRTWPALGIIDGDDDKQDVVVGSSTDVFNSNNRTFAFNSVDAEEIWKYPNGVYMGSSNTSPVIADINGDGFNETVFIVASPDGTSPIQIVALNKDGQLLNGWPKLLNATDEVNGLAVGYFGGGIKIVVGAKSGVYIYRSDDTQYNIFAIGSYNYNSQPVIADLNGDHENEILIVAAVSPSAGKIYAINSSMNPIPYWNGKDVSLQSNTNFPSVSVGNANTDIHLEVFYYSGNNLYGWDWEGNDLLNISFTNTGTRSFSAPVIADIDNNHSDAEILISIEREIKAFKIDETEIIGWNLKFKGYVSCPLVADVDNDGKNELLFNANGKMYQYKTPGTPEKNEWPSFRCNPQNTGAYANPCIYSSIPLEIGSSYPAVTTWSV
ncbi:MAG: hypothetical protein A2275_00320, partial [Bacteroidetes bacterium RIFOXYA12_FULL_35_11]